MPLHKLSLGQHIRDVQIDFSRDWRRQHLDILALAYKKAPYLQSMLALVNGVFEFNPKTIGELSKQSVIALCGFFGINNTNILHSSADLHIAGSGSQRVLDIVKYFSGTNYVTGHGAANYLDHDSFSRAGVQVEYMEYQKMLSTVARDFTPYVSALDLVMVVMDSIAFNLVL